MCVSFHHGKRKASCIWQMKWYWRVSGIHESNMIIAFFSRSPPAPTCNGNGSSSCVKALWSPQEHVFDTAMEMENHELWGSSDCYCCYVVTYQKKKKKRKKNVIFILIKPWIFQMRLSGGNLYLCVLQHWQSCLFLMSRERLFSSGEKSQLQTA